MHRNNAAIDVLIITVLLLLPPPAASTASNTPPSADASTELEPPLRCTGNQTIYECSRRKCCQSQSEVLVEQLKQIKERFQGVDVIIRRDYKNIENIIKTQLNRSQSSLQEILGRTYNKSLHAMLNTTLLNLSGIYLGNGNTDSLDTIIYTLTKEILWVTFTPPSEGDQTFDESVYPTNVKGINIFWELNNDQKKCVVEYMIGFTPYGATRDKVLEGIRNNTQSTHEYMSLLGTMVRIIEDMVKAQASDNCIDDIVNMQQCSLCTEKPVCNNFYRELLSRCVPQLEELYDRWSTFMETMSILTRRLCQNSPRDVFTYLDTLLQFIKNGGMEKTIYEHGVLAYMKCVQPDYHKRSIPTDDLYREEAMMGSESLAVPSQLEPDRYTYRKSSIFHDMRVSKRSVRSNNTTANETSPLTPLSDDIELSQCREKLGLSFPPLELGNNGWLNITRSNINTDCWNGTDIGSYITNDAYDYNKPQPEALSAMRELDEKMCRYTPKPMMEECRPSAPVPPPNNSIYKTSITKILASLTASLLYCCC